MDYKKKNDDARRSLQFISFLALSIHICLLLLFAYLHITLMVCMNVVSVLCYCLCCVLTKRDRVTECIYIAFVEILIHTILAVLSVGLDFGFQLYFIDCIAIMFFADYFSVHLGIASIGSLKLSIISGFLYAISLIAARFYDPIYHVDASIAHTGTILNSVLTLALIVLFFNMLTKTASLYEKELVKQAAYDNLTGLVNRHYLTEYMDGVHAAGSMKDHWLAIVDIDDFKDVNDKYGHLCGDFVLKSVADVLKTTCRDCIVCRWGGEEFMVVGLSAKDGEDSPGQAALLEDIRKTIADKDFVYSNGAVVKLTVTIGKADYQSDQTLDEWFSVADGRLYDGKQGGKNRVVYC